MRFLDSFLLETLHPSFTHLLETGNPYSSFQMEQSFEHRRDCLLLRVGANPRELGLAEAPYSRI